MIVVSWGVTKLVAEQTAIAKRKSRTRPLRFSTAKTVSTSLQLPQDGEVQARLQPTFMPEVLESLDPLPERVSLSPSRINETSRWSPDSSEQSERPSSQNDFAVQNTTRDSVDLAGAIPWWPG